VVEDRAVRLECWLTGLAGSSPLSAAFGAPAAPIGLTLDIGETGGMSVRTTPPKRPAKPRAVSGGAPRSQALVARVRRAVPAPLEPGVRRLRRLPLARRVYQALLKRG
jgi:hypothetical protein